MAGFGGILASLLTGIVLVVFVVFIVCLFVIALPYSLYIFLVILGVWLVCVAFYGMFLGVRAWFRYTRSPERLERLRLRQDEKQRRREERDRRGKELDRQVADFLRWHWLRILVGISSVCWLASHLYFNREFVVFSAAVLSGVVALTMLGTRAITERDVPPPVYITASAGAAFVVGIVTDDGVRGVIFAIQSIVVSVLFESTYIATKGGSEQRQKRLRKIIPWVCAALIATACASLAADQFGWIAAVAVCILFAVPPVGYKAFRYWGRRRKEEETQRAEDRRREQERKREEERRERERNLREEESRQLAKWSRLPTLSRCKGDGFLYSPSLSGCPACRKTVDQEEVSVVTGRPRESLWEIPRSWKLDGEGARYIERHPTVDEVDAMGPETIFAGLSTLTERRDFVNLGNLILAASLLSPLDTNPTKEQEVVLGVLGQILAVRFGIPEGMGYPKPHREVFLQPACCGNWNDDGRVQLIITAYAIGATIETLPSPFRLLAPYYVHLGKRQREIFESFQPPAPPAQHRAKLRLNPSNL